MEKIIFFLCSILLTISTSCNNTRVNKKNIEILKINTKLDKWHNDASESNLDEYLNFMSKDAIYIGTDKTERWNKSEFTKFCIPYFKKEQTWNFISIERNIDIKEKFAWFDELLSTQMGICRASGVLIKDNNAWKLKHYHLSITLKNDKLKEFLKIEQ